LAKRVFELAKELGVQSKSILDKCQAEGIPNINNHMSSISAGLEATIREWFSASDAQHGVTAVETTAKVDLDKVRLKPARRAKAVRKGEPDRDEADGGSTATAVVEAETETSSSPATVREAPSETRTAVQPPATPPRPAESTPAGIVAPAAEPERPSAAPAHRERRPQEEPVLAPAAKAPEVKETPRAAPERPEGDGTRPGKAPSHGPGTHPRRGVGGPSVTPAPMNVPSRPQVIKPAGPRLDVQKPAKLSGPKVVRVEAPEVVEAPRPRRGLGEPAIPTSRGPRGGEGVSIGGPATADEDTSRSPRRKKRTAPGGAVASPKRTGRSDAEFGNWREQDLLEREERISRSEGFLRQRRRDAKMRQQSVRGPTSSPAQTGGVVRITKPFDIKDLSAATGIKSAEIIKRLFMKGMMSLNPNSPIDDDVAQEVMMDWNIDLVIEEPVSAEDAVAAEFESSRTAVDVRPRPPVVTILGHVDHGKTSLLDRIRNTNVAAGEAGGITQKTSAFRVPLRMGDEEKAICFLDTPGHQAFSEMRARGANMTDIVVLVVSVVDGVMPQTIESINHAKAAKVPVVVALNKIDMPGVNDAMINRVLGQLAEQGLNPSEWGGDTDVVKTSATQGTGIQELLEVIDYRAQLMNLSADFAGPARGVVIEARLEEGRGSTANLLIQEGELKVGDVIVAGRAYGRVRDITNDRGERVKSAYPSTPVHISGLDVLPDAGDRFFIVKNARQAQEAAEQRRQKERELELSSPKVTLDSMFAKMTEGDVKDLFLVIKADFQGSVDVIKNAVQSVGTDKVRVRVLHAAAGGITESDVTLAAASGAVILGFNVIPAANARAAAEQKRVEIRSYQVIYDLVDDVKKAAEGLLAPELKQVVLGHAEVRKVFKVSRVGTIAGCYVTDGVVERNALIRVTRNDIIIENNRVLEQLKRFKDDAKEVKAGMECGMKIAGYDDIKEGDILECYRNVEVKATL